MSTSNVQAASILDQEPDGLDVYSGLFVLTYSDRNGRMITIVSMDLLAKLFKNRYIDVEWSASLLPRDSNRCFADHSRITSSFDHVGLVHRILARASTRVIASGQK